MFISRDTVTEKAKKLLLNMVNLDEEIKKRLSDFKLCRQKCRESAQEIGGVNKQFEGEYKNIGEY